MAILGTFVDRQQGVTLAGFTVTTLPHSLPATNPELMAIQLRSVASGTAQGGLFALGGNASLLTVGAASACGTGAAFFDLYSFVLYTPIR